MHGHFMYRYSVIIPSDGALQGAAISPIMMWLMRLIHRLSVEIRAFRDSAVSMGGENMRGRGSRDKGRPTAGYSQQFISPKALTF
jgi:hypothetical protein